MIIFSQGISSHSRLGNSLVWMAKMNLALNDWGILDYSFPLALESYRDYLDSSSPWVKENNSLRNSFESKFDQELTAINLQNISRKIQHNFEIKNNLKPFEWKKLIVSNQKDEYLFISGSIDINDHGLQDLISSHRIIIMHEPYNFTYKNNNKLENIDYSVIKPRLDCYMSELSFIEELSLNKKRVGLHIRRGDYKSWAEGKYFYDDDFWIKLVKDLALKNYAVWIFSNDLSENFSARLKEYGSIISNGSYAVDFVRLMCMDEIYGPPSTFTGMASRIATNYFNVNIRSHQLKPMI